MFNVVDIGDLRQKMHGKSGNSRVHGLDIEAGFIFSACSSVMEGLAFQCLKFGLDFDIKTKTNVSLFWRKCHGSQCGACEYSLLCHSGVPVRLRSLRHGGFLRKGCLAEGRTREIGRHKIRFFFVRSKP